MQLLTSNVGKTLCREVRILNDIQFTGTSISKTCIQNKHTCMHLSCCKTLQSSAGVQRDSEPETPILTRLKFLAMRHTLATYQRDQRKHSKWDKSVVDSQAESLTLHSQQRLKYIPFAVISELGIINSQFACAIRTSSGLSVFIAENVLVRY